MKLGRQVTRVTAQRLAVPQRTDNDVTLCANDPVSAWGGARILRDSFSIEPAVVTGPATDNAVGVDQITDRLKVPAINALSNGVALGDLVAGLLKGKEAA